jgi:nucleoid DNA-binding protein
MNRIIQRLAKQSDVAPANAADELDKVLHGVLRRLREGKPATLPGLGSFVPGTEIRFEFKKQNDKKTTKTVREKAQKRNAGRARA